MAEPHEPTDLECDDCGNPMPTPESVLKCLCGMEYCERCFEKHMRQIQKRGQQSKHGPSIPSPPSQAEELWENITSAFAHLDIPSRFIQDEKAKWFGLRSQKSNGRNDSPEAQYIVETSRLKDLIAQSLNLEDSPATQYPSFASFVGITGAGKSLLIQYLISLGKMENETGSNEFQIPVTGSSSQLDPTTGEVNLYADPSTFGTSAPIFLADCEGIGGGISMANDYQKKWHDVKNHGRAVFQLEHRISDKEVLEDLYPRLLYIFSDVVCYVVSEKSWPLTIARLLSWSTTGAQHAINQAALPALILILNSAEWAGEDEWVSDTGGDVLTGFVLKTMQRAFAADSKLRKKAREYGISPDTPASASDTSTPLEKLLLKSYSSVHTHFIPRMGLGRFGCPEAMLNQVVRLRERIKLGSKRVQKVRAKSMTMFDHNQLVAIASYAFSHISQNLDTPFDFGLCRLLTSKSIETHIARFLKVCVDRADVSGLDLSTLFKAATSVIASAIVKKAQSSKNQAIVELHIFHEGTRSLCKEALNEFFENYMPCSYVNRDPPWKCVNTRSGHAKGHQPAIHGALFPIRASFATGEFEAATAEIYNEDKFMTEIETKVSELTQIVKDAAGSNPAKWYSIVRDKHDENVDSLRKLEVFSMKKQNESITTKMKENLFTQPKFCFYCLFGKSEYRLPCQHLICGSCAKENSVSDQYRQEPEATISLKRCILCTEEGPCNKWPFSIQTLPKLADPRILALDGAGVRAIAQLFWLISLEEIIGIGLPIGQFFDLIVGSSMSGIVALGIGTQDLCARDCLEQFKLICDKGFVNKLGTKTFVPGLQSLTIRFRGSIYLQEPYKNVIRDRFFNGQEDIVFGLQNHCRVAVTTTVKSKASLIANYQTGEGDDKRYTDATMSTWEAAMCASAAPPYFAPMLVDGTVFRDGGLKANNPVHIALEEAKLLWGKPRPDSLISMGTGLPGGSLQPEPAGLGNLDAKIAGYLRTWLGSIDGQQAWDDFRDSQSGDVLARCNRLNTSWDWIDPTFDDLEISDIDMQHMSWEELVSKSGMVLLRSDFGSQYIPQIDNPYEPVAGPCTNNILAVQADILRASLYFFQVSRICKVDHEMFYISGSLKCRIGVSDSRPYDRLLGLTEWFAINGRGVYGMHEFPRNYSNLFDAPVQFEHTSTGGPIRIDVKFKALPYLVTISGFPMDFQALRDHCAENGIKEEKYSSSYHWQSQTYPYAESSIGDPYERVRTPGTDALNFADYTYPI
ncbi:hypothetical protein TWF481_003922 [Arthrobotrys musiformis]|uniref:PNPLA domain-containing protein n=1 Tax=Arthrobotrys musiformis TaxID=47236 RepID=A0AAV9WIZ1_9PEZI